MKTRLFISKEESKVIYDRYIIPRITRAKMEVDNEHGVRRSVNNAQKNGEENKRSPRAPLFDYIMIP